MAKKRGNGEGSILKRKDGRWQAAFSAQLPTGEHKRIYHYGNTRKECADWLTEMQHKASMGKPVTAADIPLIEWLEEWFRKYCINIRDSTRMNYTTYLTHIRRHRIGQIHLSKLTTDDLQDFILFLQDNGKLDNSGGLSAKTIRNLFQMLHKALKQAVGNQIIWSNPSDYVELPKVHQKEVEFLSADELHRLIEASNDETWQIGLILMMATGIRIGELLALRQDSICCEEGIWYLNIRQTLQRVKNFNAKEGEKSTVLRCSDPKTDNSRRKIPLLPEVVTLLQTHVTRQKTAADQSYGLYETNPYLISNEIGECVDPSTFRKWFSQIIKRTDIQKKVTPHKLRHSFASHCLKNGMDIKNISSLLGHYSTEFSAKVYVHTDLEGSYQAMTHCQSFIQNLLNSQSHRVITQKGNYYEN